MLPTPLRVRVALHTGEADLREGDYYGTAVNRCARLRAAAHGGQTLVSAATQELVRDQLPETLALRDLGEHRLKDLQRPEHIFQLIVPGLPADFPPLTTLDNRPHNLPVERSPLIGRETALAALGPLLLRADVGLVTLTGPGGTGKTRLALQVAADLSDHFDDGVYFVNLASITDHNLVVSEIARTLRVRESAGQPPLETLEGDLRNKRLLLVLDNFEQVAQAAPVVAHLLAAAPALTLLVTSRVPLHIRGEREYALPPLQLPDTTRLPPVERLVQYEAVRLFIERAVEVKSDFRVTNDNAPAVAEICARLDGLPLAIELAAARSKVLTPQAILARLGHRLTLLTGGARDAAARQQTLRNTIDWSYDLLSGAERQLFRRLAVFAGGRTLDAIDAVCGGADGELDALDGVSSLVDKSLVRHEEGGAGGDSGEPRFVMLETIHEYAREKLEESGEAEALQGRHARYFLALAEEAEPQLTGPAQARWLARLEAEHANLRAALGWATERGEVETALRLAGALWWFWLTRGHLGEGRRWLERALAGGAAPARSRAKALLGAGSLAVYQGDDERAEALLAEAQALYREQGDRQGTAETLQMLGIQRGQRGDYPGAMALFEESLAHFRAAGDGRGIARTLNNLGFTALARGDLARATPLLEEGLALQRARGEERAIAVGLQNLGWAALRQGDPGRARALFAESLAGFEALGDRQNGADCLAGLAAAAGAAGQGARAARLFGAAEALHKALGAATMTAPGIYEGQLAAARAQLNGAAWEALLAEGRAMPPDEAIAYALAEDPPE